VQKKTILRYSAGLIFLALLVACISIRAQAASPRAITVVLDDNYPPYSFRDDHGKLQGILKDTWALWSVRSGITVNYQAMDWNLAQKRMYQGQADVIDTLFITPERQKFYDFSEPYANINVPIFFHKNISGIVDANSLKGFTVGVKAGDACISTLNQHGITNLKPYPSYKALIQAAGHSEIVVFCLDQPPASYFLYKMGLEHAFRYTKPLYVGQFHWAVRRGNLALKTSVEAGFKRISSAERQHIANKWQGAQLASASNAETMRLALEALGGILLLVALLILWNISLRRRVASKTAEQAATLRYLSATLSALPDLLFEMDIHGVYYDYRASCSDLLVAPPEQLLQHKVTEVMPKRAAESVLAALNQAAQHGTSHGTQISLDLTDGKHWFELSVARKQVDPGASERFIVISRDISERKKAEAHIEDLAFFDPLTHLPNRRALHESLMQVLAAGPRHDQNAALLFIDIDNFKTLNDTRGHRIGDALLLAIAQQMRTSLRDTDYLGRFGGDEFVVILENLNPHLERAISEIETVAEKLLIGIRQPCWLEGLEYHPTASIGICLFSGRDDIQEDEVLKRADMAMYRAKARGRNTHCFFDPSMQAIQESRARLEAELRQAVAEMQFELFYQAQVDEHRGIIGAEALLRWRHAERGLIHPAQFISQAEETGMIIPIGQWVIHTACALLQQWRQQAHTQALFLSVNVSARQFQQPDFVHQVHQALVKYDVEPGKLKFELTESLVLHNVADSIEKMHLLAAMGIRLSLDDFGTGYASLSYLKRLPLHEIKIDRTFMRNITKDHGNAVIVRTIIHMAKNFDLDIVAEGVEHPEQRDFLYQNGCSQFQGFLISRPVPLAQFEALLRPPFAYD